MMTDILKQMNWVDVLTGVILIRIVYISAKTGFVTEFMKMLGVLLSVFFAFHFYVKLAAILAKSTNMDVGSLEMLSFGVIWMFMHLACVLLRNGLLLVFTVETLSLVDRWGAAAASLVRFFLTVSMVMFMFLVTDIPYLEKMTFGSFSQKYVLNVAPKVYDRMMGVVVVKFFPDQRKNPAVANELGKADAR
ncbi:MAG: CvpA family protein [Candidatus Omnitrophota bacterium]